MHRIMWHSKVCIWIRYPHDIGILISSELLFCPIMRNGDNSSIIEHHPRRDRCAGFFELRTYFSYLLQIPKCLQVQQLDGNFEIPAVDLY